MKVCFKVCTFICHLYSNWTWVGQSKSECCSSCKKRMKYWTSYSASIFNDLLGRQRLMRCIHSRKSHTNQLGFTYFKVLCSINLYEISTYSNVLDSIRYRAQSSMPKKEGNIWLIYPWPPHPPSERKLGRLWFRFLIKMTKVGRRLLTPRVKRFLPFIDIELCTWFLSNFLLDSIWLILLEISFCVE